MIFLDTQLSQCDMTKGYLWTGDVPTCPVSTQNSAKWKSVKISGFGNFEVHTKTARPGRNPQTGEPVVIAARKVVTFRASGSLRQQINKDD